MKQGTLDVQAFAGVPPQDQYDQQIYDQAAGSHSHNNRCLDLRWGHEAPVGFDQNPSHYQPESQRVKQRRQNLDALKTEGSLDGRRAARHPYCQKRQGKGRAVSNHVTRVSQQGQAAGSQPSDDFGNHVHQGQCQGDD